MTEKSNLSKEEFIRIVLNDYRVAVESREASFLGRREVLSGKAKFGIFGNAFFGSLVFFRNRNTMVVIPNRY